MRAHIRGTRYTHFLRFLFSSLFLTCSVSLRCYLVTALSIHHSSLITTPNKQRKMQSREQHNKIFPPLFSSLVVTTLSFLPLLLLVVSRSLFFIPTPDLTVFVYSDAACCLFGLLCGLYGVHVHVNVETNNKPCFFLFLLRMNTRFARRNSHK